MSNPRTDFMDAICELVKDKSIGKISIDEIVRTAGYSRQTFYRYFTDKYALAFAVYQRDIENAIARLADHWEFDDLCIVMLRCFSERPGFYKKMFRKNNIDNSFHRQFVEYSTNFTLEAIGRKKLSRDQRLLVRYWVSNTVSLIEDWVMGGMEREEAWMVDMYKRLMPEEIKSLYFS